MCKKPGTDILVANHAFLLIPSGDDVNTEALKALSLAAAVAAMHFDIAAYRPAAAKTPYARPLEVGGFSRIDGEQFFDKRALRQYSAPRLPNSLATGYSDFVPKRDDKHAAERCLLAAVERYADQTSKAHFVTYRNNLNKLLATLIVRTTTGALASSASLISGGCCACATHRGGARERIINRMGKSSSPTSATASRRCALATILQCPLTPTTSTFVFSTASSATTD